MEEVRLGHGGAQAGDRRFEPTEDVVHRPRARGRIRAVVSGHRLEQQRGVRHRRRQRPDVVHRPRQRHHPGPAHAAVRRLEPDHAAAGRGQPDRAAGVAADRTGDEPRGHRRCRATRRAARGVAGLPRVLHVAVVRVVAERAHRELRHVGLAEQDRAGRGQPRRRRARHVAAEVVARARATRGRQPRDHAQVLVSHGHAVQRAAEAAGHGLRLQRACGGERAVGVHGDERPQHRVAALDARQTLAHELHRRDPLRPHRVRQRRSRRLHRQRAPTDSRGAVAGGVRTMLTYVRTGQSYLNRGGRYAEFFPEVLKLSEGRYHCDYGYHLAPITADHVDEMETLATAHGVPSFKIFMFYGGYGLHGTAGADEQRRFLMTGPDDHYDLAHFEFVMREAARIRAEHPTLAEHVSVSLHCEMADILNAYTRLVQQDASLSGLAAYSAARPPHAEGLAVAVAAYLAHETACVNVNLLHLSSRKALETALTIARAFPHVNFRREVTIGHLLLDIDTPARAYAKVNPPIRPREDVEYVW